MLTKTELIEFAENLMQAENTPSATKASLLRTILEIKGLIGSKATGSSVDEDSVGSDLTAEQLKEQIALLEA